VATGNDLLPYGAAPLPTMLRVCLVEYTTVCTWRFLRLNTCTAEVQTDNLWCIPLYNLHWNLNFWKLTWYFAEVIRDKKHSKRVPHLFFGLTINWVFANPRTITIPKFGNIGLIKQSNRHTQERKNFERKTRWIIFFLVTGWLGT